MYVLILIIRLARMCIYFSVMLHKYLYLIISDFQNVSRITILQQVLSEVTC